METQIGTNAKQLAFCVYCVKCMVNTLIKNMEKQKQKQTHT